MASITTLSEAELMALYRENVGRVEFWLNEALPHLWRKEQIAFWRRDTKSLRWLQRARDTAVLEHSFSERKVRLARDELARRDPARFADLPTHVEAKLEGYQRPEMYEIWKAIHNVQ